MDRYPSTLNEALRCAAESFPENGVCFVAGKHSEFQSYLQLLEHAQRILSGLTSCGIRAGDKVLLVMHSPAEFLPSLWACVLGNIIPVPVSASVSQIFSGGFAEKLASIWRLLDDPLLVTSEDLIDEVQSQAARAGLDNIRVANFSALSRHEEHADVRPSRPDDLAILLMTSGTTTAPKLVQLTHRNLISMAVASAQMNGFDRHEITLNWLPLDHVGAISFLHIMPIVLGCQQIQSESTTVMRSPVQWLDLIHRFRATISWAPNFAFRLINDHEDALERFDWDLSCLKFLVNAGETVVMNTIIKFCRLLAPSGLQIGAVRPAFGMSECASGITWSDGNWVKSVDDPAKAVEVGRPIPGAGVRIVDERDEVVPEGEIGRLQLSGPTVTGGYFMNDEASRQSFTEDGWFRTGDLGFIRDQRLHITGREKDVLIVNGLHFVTHEIESVIEELPGVANSFTAVVAFREADSDTDGVSVFFSPTDEANDKTRDEIGQLILQRFGLKSNRIISLPIEEIPKTAIGKIRKSELKERLAAGEFGSV